MNRRFIALLLAARKWDENGQSCPSLRKSMCGQTVGRLLMGKPSEGTATDCVPRGHLNLPKQFVWEGRHGGSMYSRASVSHSGACFGRFAVREHCHETK